MTISNVLDGAGVGMEVMVARGVVACGVALTYPLLVTPARTCLDRALTFWIMSKPPADDSNDAAMEDTYSLHRTATDENAPLITPRSTTNTNPFLPSLGWRGRMALSWNTKRTKRLRFFLETFTVVLTSYSIAVAIPNLEKIFALFGALTGSLIVYVFPAIFYIQALRQKNRLEVQKYIFVHRNYAMGNNEPEGERLLSTDAVSPVPVPTWSLIVVYVNIFVGR
jgi:hypothetical protein